MRVLNDSPSTENTDYIESLCMVFTGSRLLKGKIEGVVVQTGEDTCVAKLIKRKMWPLPEVILTV